MQQTPTQSANIAVKLRYQSQIRRFVISATATWTELESKIYQLLNLSYATKLFVKYEDEDKDLINVDTTTELHDAIALSGNKNVLLLEVTVPTIEATKPTISEIYDDDLILVEPEVEKSNCNTSVDKEEVPLSVSANSDCTIEDEIAKPITSSANQTSTSDAYSTLEANLTKLAELGFTNRSLNRRILIRNPPTEDLSTVVELIIARQNKSKEGKGRNRNKCHKRNRSNSTNEEEKYAKKRPRIRLNDISEDVFTQLNELGFTDRRINCCALRRFYSDDGDLTRVIDFLTIKKEKFDKVHEKRNRKLHHKLARSEAKKNKCSKKLRGKREKLQRMFPQRLGSAEQNELVDAISVVSLNEQENMAD